MKSLEKFESDQHKFTMESRGKEYPSFFCCESDSSHLESVAETYFNHRPFEEDFENDSSSDSDFSSDEEADQNDSFYLNNDLEFSNFDKSEREKVEGFIRESCHCTQGDQGKSCSSTIKVEDIIDCRNNCLFVYFFFFNDTATTEIYTLSLHDALPIC